MFKMCLWKFTFLTVILIVNVSCLRIISSLTPTNLLSPSMLAHYKQNPHFKHHISDLDNEYENDHIPPTTKTTRTDSNSNLSLMNIFRNEIATIDALESEKKLMDTQKNKTKEDFVKNYIFYKWLMATTNGLDQKSHDDSVDDNWQYYDDSDDDDDNISSYDFETFNEDKRSALRSAMSRRSQKKKEMGESFLPSNRKLPHIIYPLNKPKNCLNCRGDTFVLSNCLKDGGNAAMSNLDDFFSHLNTNIKSLETTPNYHHISFDDVAYLESQIANNKKEYTNDYYVKPSGTAAFLHAIRSYRPSQKIRALVAMQPESYRGSNFHDPNFLWQGLGK